METIFIKLGGSLITDKRQRYHARDDVLARLSAEIARARVARPELRVVIGHGSGSFGHVAARESGYDPKAGHASPLALAQVGAAASALNHRVRAALLAAGIPALSLPPSASARLRDGAVVAMAADAFESVLTMGAIPLTFGDVALFADGSGAGIASTEMVFRYLADRLQPQRILLLGIVEGVLARAPSDTDPHPPLIPTITPATWPAIRDALGGSHGTDVTGGMASKVAEALALAQAVPSLVVRIVSGEEPGLLERLLLDSTAEVGTVVRA